MLAKIINFIKVDIWRIQLKKIPKTKSILIKQLRVVLLSFRKFLEDECQQKASALTFYSLLSIVPVLAMAFGIAKGFGFAKVLEVQILEKVPGQEEVIMQVIDFANSLLENTKGGLIAGIGVVLLFWTVIKVLGNIERSFNSIWGIREPRTIGRKFGDYLAMMLLCPVLIITSGSITVFITTQITEITRKVALLGFLSQAIFTMLKILPYCMVWVLFSFVYIFMPNTKVRAASAILAGVVAGTVFQLVQWVYIYFQVGVARYNAIYGSFAALPLFLMWLQLSWLIVLFGAEISFAYQNVDTYEFEPDCLSVSHSFKKLFALEIMHLLVKNFHEGEPPLTAAEISHKTEGPIRLVRQILFELVESGVVSEAKTGEYKEFAYQPARDIDSISIKSIIDALDSRGSSAIPLSGSKSMAGLTERLKVFSDTVKASPANALLRDI